MWMILREKAILHSDNLAALMVTYPSTHGVFESEIQEITQASFIEHGGQVYMDGANMNAQVGLTNPATIGADVCHSKPAQNICHSAWRRRSRSRPYLCRSSAGAVFTFKPDGENWRKTSNYSHFWQLLGALLWPV